MPVYKQFAYKNILLTTLVSLPILLTSEKPLASGGGGAGFNTAGKGGHGDGESGGGGYYAAYDTRQKGSEGVGARGGDGYIAPGGAGGNVGIRLQNNVGGLGSYSGQSGSVGSDTQGCCGAGGGGAGGAGVYWSNNNDFFSLGQNAQLRGGNGGKGGDGVLAGGGGGGGGAGLQGVSNSGSVQFGATTQLIGGDGGNGGLGYYEYPETGGGGGGGGGSGVNLRGSSNAISVQGQVRGGNGGIGGVVPNATFNGTGGQGGVGIRLEGNNNNLAIGGSVSGGLNGTDGRFSDAVQLLGNNNFLELSSGYQLRGNVYSEGTGNTLALTGNNAGSFDVSTIGTQILNFTFFEKRENGTWTLSGTSTGNRTWTVLGGTLIGSTTSFGSGNLDNNANVVFDQSQAGAYNGTISGTGTLAKTGAGTLTLLRQNTHTGTTTVTQGTLQIGNGGTAGSLTGDILNNANLRFNRSDVTTYAGAISGSGAVNQAGSGTLILTGDNRHTGGTQISAGTLQVGNGGTAGSLTGDILNNANLRFNRSDLTTYAGAISGSGAVNQVGSGTLILTGDNRHTSGTQISAGTLQIGSGGTAGSLTGDILNNANLRFNRSDLTTYAGAISGSGAVNQSGSGTLIVTGDNRHTGGTQISAGTLQIGNGGSAGSLTGDILNNANLRFNRSDLTTYAGAISGSGAVNQAGSGTLILTGDNRHTGGTQISAGTLQIGNGGTAGSLTGDILNNASLVFDRVDNITYLGSISGNGQVIQAGSGNLTLGNDNRYLGATRISSGSLTGSARSFGSGAIINEGELILDQQTDGVLSNQLSGQGSLRKTGAGKLVIESSASAGGGTLIESGSLVIGGAAGSSASFASTVTATAGTLLGGHGRVAGDVRMLAGSTLATGNSIGTLTLDGDLILDAGSTFEAEVDSTGNSDRLISSGTVYIGGATLRVLASPGEWSPTTAYSLIKANRVEGNFATVTSNLAFLTADVDYSLADEVRLTLLRNDIRFDSVARTYNQRATASAVESAGVSQRVYRAISALDPERARVAFDSLSGELHASLQDALLDDSRYQREVINTRMLAAQQLLTESGRLNTGDSASLWMQSYGGSAKNQGDGNTSSLNNRSGGSMIGLDVPVSGSWRIGTAIGLGKGDIDDGRESSADTTTTTLAVYAAGQWENIRLRMGAGRSWHDVDTRRNAAVGMLSEKPRAGYSATTTQAFAELGYRLPMDNYQVEPFLGIARAEGERGAFRERGGEAALTGSDTSQALNYATLGAHAALPLPVIAGVATTLKGSLGWQRAFGDDASESRHALVGSEDFKVRSATKERNSAVTRLGIAAPLNDKVLMDLTYDGRFGENYRDNGIRLGLTARF